MPTTKSLFAKQLEITKSNIVTIQIGIYNEQTLLNIFKSVFSEKYTGIAKDGYLAFDYDNAIKLKKIIDTIDANNLKIDEYGSLEKGKNLFKVAVSNFQGKNYLQIRIWYDTDKYTGFGKKGVSVPIEFLDEFKSKLNKVVNFFKGYQSGEIVEEAKQDNKSNIPNKGDEISYKKGKFNYGGIEFSKTIMKRFC